MHVWWVQLDTRDSDGDVGLRPAAAAHLDRCRWYESMKTYLCTKKNNGVRYDEMWGMKKVSFRPAQHSANKKNERVQTTDSKQKRRVGQSKRLELND